MLTTKGSFFVQLTNATGCHKTAEFLFEDIKTAIAKIGPENVFIVCMDGACQKTLRLINDGIPKVFGQRCSTHGCSLLMADIAKSFVDELKLIGMLLHFVCNHDGIYDVLCKMPGALNLLGVVDSR